MMAAHLSQSNPTSDLEVGAPLAALPGAWCYWVSAELVGLVSVYHGWMN